METRAREALFMPARAYTQFDMGSAPARTYTAS